MNTKILQISRTEVRSTSILMASGFKFTVTYSLAIHLASSMGTADDTLVLLETKHASFNSPQHQFQMFCHTPQPALSAPCPQLLPCGFRPMHVCPKLLSSQHMHAYVCMFDLLITLFSSVYFSFGMNTIPSMSVAGCSPPFMIAPHGASLALMRIFLGGQLFSCVQERQVVSDVFTCNCHVVHDALLQFYVLISSPLLCHYKIWS